MIPFFSLCVYVVQYSCILTVSHSRCLSPLFFLSLSLNNTVIINVSFRLFLALSLKGVHFHFIMLNYLIWLAFCLSCTNANDFSSLFVLPIHYVGCRCVCVCMLFSFHIFVVYLFFIVSFVVFLLCTVLLCVLFSLKTKMLKNHKQQQHTTIMEPCCCCCYCSPIFMSFFFTTVHTIFNAGSSLLRLSRCYVVSVLFCYFFCFPILFCRRRRCSHSCVVMCCCGYPMATYICFGFLLSVVYSFSCCFRRRCSRCPFVLCVYFFGNFLLCCWFVYIFEMKFLLCYQFFIYFFSINFIQCWWWTID